MAAPYANINISSNKNHESLISYTDDSIYAVFQPKERIYIKCEFQYFGINGVSIKYTNMTILVHAIFLMLKTVSVIFGQKQQCQVLQGKFIIVSFSVTQLLNI